MLYPPSHSEHCVNVIAPGPTTRQAWKPSGVQGRMYPPAGYGSRTSRSPGFVTLRACRGRMYPRARPGKKRLSP